ncbi:hypothetical protein ASPZODRAFT_134374 [Penicilliopsis zonata CBS 506.65]|uniref:RING-type domain-containing protein n=1 Tax=Penicilliopsis zonata CBS 506.65 TaxID=1073090 RepID=A0A1L9SCS5_9EURO|nr:hypothetical protein ASPZODRAFT_134374 [Penicilliopsis zonata CBS 506.65]OJJ44954.1 hypothetical protein ASPZODRAFT_134374 [Penicilliopsis zonata CBS 506.65]
MADTEGASASFSAPAGAASSAVIEQIRNATAESTRHFLLSSSPRELLKLPFRVLNQAESFALNTLPRNAMRLAGLGGLAESIWGNAPGVGLENEAMAAAAHEGVGIMGEGLAAAAAEESGLGMIDMFQALRRFGGFFSYLTSRWSLACFTVALVLNRITIYASTRRHLNLNWERRLALRILPILLFVSQILSLLRAIRCQTSPDYSAIRYGKPGKRLIFDHAGDGGFLYSLGSTLLPWESDEQSCSAVGMGQPINASDIPYGSFSLLWPVFIRLCLSHFVETLSCALQGRVVVTEAGMSIFEQSLAFAEAESMISNSIGLGIFGLSKETLPREDASPRTESGSSAVLLLTKTQVLDRMNVTPELLLIALISCCNSMTSHILDVLGLQSRFRFLHTSIWGLCFMSAMVWGLLPNGSEPVVLKFPTVCIVGFIPHLLILIGILICLLIYALALTITAFSLPSSLPQPLSLYQRFMLAHENMQGANQIQNIRFNRHEDFYTTLLRIGYGALTAASEAVFLNEGKKVVARRMTWLEEDRLTEIELSRRQHSSNRVWADSTGNGTFEDEVVNFEIQEAMPEWESGYNREKRIEKRKNGSRSVRSQDNIGGVGAFRGASRCYNGVLFFRGIFFLLLRWIAYGLDKLLDKVGIKFRPQWFKIRFQPRRGDLQNRDKGSKEPLDFWILSDDGELELPEDDDFDVEKEMRKRERSNNQQWEQADENRLDDKLYGWWKSGGSWGNQDQSPDYAPPAGDVDDTTSVISMSTNAESEWEEYESDDGRRTPTQANPYLADTHRETTPIQESLFDAKTLVRLLDPRDRESRQEAQFLAAHISAEQEGRILTRCQYRRQLEREQAQVLFSRRSYHAHFNNDEKRKPTPDEESQMLENLILSRRSEASSSVTQDEEQTWASGASGLGPNGPPCVICQTNPRSIIVWPCRCLCVCEECRVSLAMNNFGSCVTCRQEVGGFMRLWVP